MPYQHTLCTQTRRNTCGVVPRVPHKNKVGLRRQHLEAHVFQLQHQAFAGVYHRLARGLKVTPIFDCGRRTGLRQPVQRVRVKAVLHTVQRVDQMRLPTCKPNAQPGQ